MKKRRSLLLILLAMLLFFGIPTGFLVHEYHQERLDHELIDAIRRIDENAALQALNEGASPNSYDYTEDTPTPIGKHIKQLVNNIIHPNKRRPSERHTTALILVFETMFAHLRPITPSQPFIGYPPQYLNMMKALLDKGADPNAKGKYGQRALMWAVLLSYDESIRLLIQRGADVNIREFGGCTPLMQAATSTSPSMVRILLDNGADVNIRTPDGMTALDYRQDANHPESFYFVPDANQPEIEAMLRKAGAKTGQELSAQSTTLPKR